MDSKPKILIEYSESPMLTIEYYKEKNIVLYDNQIHLWKCIHANDTILYSNVYYTPDSNKYIHIIPQNYFEVKADNDVHICIHLNNIDYEIVLGGWNNTLSVIRNGKQGNIISEYKGSVLSSNKFNAFQIEVNNSGIFVYHCDMIHKKCILTTICNNTNDNISHFNMSIKSCFGSSAFWKWSPSPFDFIKILFLKNTYENYDSFYNNNNHLMK